MIPFSGMTFLMLPHAIYMLYDSNKIHNTSNKQRNEELLGVWHMVTIMLFASSIFYFKYGFNTTKKADIVLVSFISYLYIAFSFAFIFSSVYKSILAPQWVLLLPIGILGIIGVKKSKTNA
jgi:small-conductance mechanosensitive channel